MRRALIIGLTVLAVGGITAWSQTSRLLTGLKFQAEEKNPVSRLAVPEDSGRFQFAIVSDRTGSHRADIFSQAVHKLNLLQPEFVMSVGDLIEGAANKGALDSQWKEFNQLVGQLKMPFFYVPGNHDTGNATSLRDWEQKFGRSQYHFIYRDVLFLILNSDDPTGANGSISKTQSDWAARVLAANANVRWTLVFVHRPLWRIADGAKNGWQNVERALQGRKYTVFSGHVHRYEKFVRGGMNYYQFATTGGGSLVRGVDYREFDHLVWVTMTADGPTMANVMLDAVHNESLTPEKTNEPEKTRVRHPVTAVSGKAFFGGEPMFGARIMLKPPANAKAMAAAEGRVEADGSFKLTTYGRFDGATPGEFSVVVDWPASRFRAAAEMSPLVGNIATTPLRVTVHPTGVNELVIQPPRK